jgi:CHAT domain-containing protein
LPWSMLPMCRGRAVSVTPSSWLWWQAAQRSSAGGGEVLVAGPAPAYALTEVLALHAGRPEARILIGTEATVEETIRALDGASLAHVASHGVFRADNPLFSHLVLTDGQLTVCDLGLMRHAPDVLILSSCDAGLSAVHPGDELQGLAVALLGLGTRCVIASLGLVDDATTAQLMVDVHDHLRGGATPAAALALAQSAAADQSPGVANFVCLGAG